MLIRMHPMCRALELEVLGMYSQILTTFTHAVKGSYPSHIGAPSKDLLMLLHSLKQLFTPAPPPICSVYCLDITL